MKKESKPFIFGATASIILIAFYFIIVSLAESFEHAMREFLDYYLLLIPLAAGFGIQVGLYTFLRESMRSLHAVKTVTASGGMSTTSMVACCAHHLVDIAPLLGVTAAAAFLAKYQVLFMVIGLFSNALGILIMLEVIKNNEIYDKSGYLLFVKRYDLRLLQKATFIIGIAASIVAIIFFPVHAGLENSITKSLGSQSRQIGDIIFGATPSFVDGALEISFSIDTHTGSLDFEMDKVSQIVDSKKKRMLPLEWNGSAPGGHHRKGILRFSKPNGSFTLYITLDDGSTSFKWGG